jgi:hypothetical protein
MNYYKNVTKEINYLLNFYTEAQLENYAKGNEEMIINLYKITQPKKVPIGSLMGETEKKTFMVSSPDGWVPVTDCIEKIKYDMFEIRFASGRSIVASHDHLFQTTDLEWVYARDLHVNQLLLSINGVDSVKEIVKITKKTRVYDLSVNHPNHRYYTNDICSHNSGKSLFMQNLAVNWFQRGLNGIYITLELSEEICSLRIDSITTSINSKEIFKKIDDVEYRVKMMGKKSGSFYVKYMPAQSNINHIRSYCKDFELNTGKKIDFLCIDYLDLLMPISVKVSPSDLFVKDKYVSEEIRNMAKEMNVLCVTASQLNRSAVETQEINQSHISGGISKINTADNVIGIMTSVSMRDRGMYQLQLLKTRNSNGFGKKINLDYDVETLKITDSNVDGDDGIVESLGTQIAQNPLPLNNKPVVSNTTDNKKQMLDSLLKGIKSR